MADSKPILVVGLGGNALIQKGEAGTAEQQLNNLKIPARQLAKLSRSYRIVITHGNGPQVGNLLLQQESCDAVPEMPLELLVAQTQGQIGYMIESTLDEELMKIGIDFRPLVTLITYVVVDKNDPAFRNPTKPIGPSYAEERAARVPYPTMKTPKGFRRVVASPEPVTIVEKREIKMLLDQDFIVICGGGGGIPVIREERKFRGMEAVIDKDLASSLLAREVGADLFVIATDVEGVLLNFGKPDQSVLRTLNTEDSRRYLEEEQFGIGSMRPKVEAAGRFAEKTGNPAFITSTGAIEDAITGNSGTRFHR